MRANSPAFPWLEGLCRALLLRRRLRSSPWAATEDTLTVFKSRKFRGVVLILSAPILSYLAASRRVPVLTVHARPRIEIILTITNVVTITSEAPKVCSPLPGEAQGRRVSLLRLVGQPALLNGVLEASRLEHFNLDGD